jgi:hypothetical protein
MLMCLDGNEDLVNVLADSGADVDMIDAVRSCLE